MRTMSAPRTSLAIKRAHEAVEKQMRKRTLFLSIVTAVVAGAAAFGWLTIRRGFSARDNPSALEACRRCGVWQRPKCSRLDHLEARRAAILMFRHAANRYRL